MSRRQQRSTKLNFNVGDQVRVASRTWPGINKLGGDGTISKDNGDGSYYIKYALGGYELAVE